MRHTSFEDSATLREFAKLVEKQDGLKKEAQMAPVVNKGPMLDLQALANETDPRKWQALIAQEKAVDPAMAKRMQDAWYTKSYQGKSNEEVLAVLQGQAEHDPFAGIAVAPKGDLGGAQMAPAKKMPPMSKHQAEELKNVKTAEKEYDAMPDSDMTGEAHPKTAKIEGETIENGHEQQKADMAVAQKSATVKVLKELTKIAEELKAEGNAEAYKLVVKTAREIYNAAGLAKK